MTGARTVIVVPMFKENDNVGIIIIYRQEVRLFTDKHVALLTNFASFAFQAKIGGRAKIGRFTSVTNEVSAVVMARCLADIGEYFECTTNRRGRCAGWRSSAGGRLPQPSLLMPPAYRHKLRAAIFANCPARGLSSS
jgi:hypothetical protein